MLKRDSVEINFVSSLPLPEQTRLATDMRKWAIFLGISPLIIKITASGFLPSYSALVHFSCRGSELFLF